MKWSFWLLAIVLGVGLFLLALLYIALVKSVPSDSANVKIPMLNQPVQVVFDKHAVPHVSAEEQQDAMRAIGYLHARDRLWQMEVLRLVGKGRMSEVFGEATVETDIFLQTLGLADASRSSYDKLLPETRASLQAYSEGVNSFLDQETGLFGMKYSPEFLVLGHTPSHWQPWESVLVLKVMGLTLGSNMDLEIKRFKLAMTGFKPDEIDDLVPYGPRDNPPDLPELLSVYDVEPISASLKRVRENKRSPELAEALVKVPIGQSASNNWVVSGKRTESGMPLLANDPHLGFTTPSTFYLAHMSWKHNGADKHAIGGTLPGVPYVVVGRTGQFAWGLTTTGLDSQDLFLEKVNEKEGTYETENGPQNISVSAATVKIGSEESRTIEIRHTRNGPLLPKSFKDIGTYLPDGYELALAWPGYADDDTTMDMLARNNSANTVWEFFNIIERSVSPMQSIVVADSNGNIGVAAVARVPKRKPENKINGRAPVPGWLNEYQWDGYVPHNKQLVIQNPIENAITTANANYMPKGFEPHYTYDWAEHFRQARAEELVLKRVEKHSVAASQEMIGDDFSPAMVQFRDVALRVMPGGVGRFPKLIDRLAEWDGRMDRNTPEPLVMLAWFRHLNIGLFKDDLGDVFSEFERGRLTRIIGILSSYSARNWCDNRATEKQESCADVLSSSLDAAMDEMSKAHGNDWRRWRYGAEHLAYHEHRPFSRVAPLAGIFTIETSMSGGPYTLLRGQTKFNEDRPYLARHGAAYRAVYDFSDLDNSLYMISTGQSGNVMSEHYDDLSQLWGDMKFIKMSTKRTDYETDALGTWEFTP